MLVYQAADDDLVATSSFFMCDSFVSDVQFDDPDNNSSVFAFPDEQAQIWAGAIASTGFEINGDQRQWQTYSGNTQFSENGPITAFDAQTAISQYAAYGLAAYDTNGVMMNVTASDDPESSLQLDVEWKWAIAVLALIPSLQFFAYVAVIIWANKAIIKDDSYLSTAKLLQPIVSKIGEGGCILTGDDIARRQEFQSARVAYGFSDPGPLEDEKRIRHLGVMFQHSNFGHRPTVERSFPDGWYNGPPDEKAVKRTARRRLSV